jgi:homoserine O-succinyltransferase
LIANMTIVPGQRCNSADRGLRVGLVNNMPDSALAGTERQFLNLLNSAAPSIPIEVIFYSVPGIPRCAAGRQHLSDHFYGSTHDLADARLDAVIVTGTEPRQPSLENEPYWHEMKALFDFLEREGLPAMFSCRWHRTNSSCRKTIRGVRSREGLPPRIDQRFGSRHSGRAFAVE